MLGLQIQELGVFVEAGEATFSSKTSFKSGLNIIRADNHSGKSTCINAIAYGLGLESVLGPSRGKPFGESMYVRIFESETTTTPYFVTKSFIELTIVNSLGQVAILKRDVLGNDKLIKVTTSGNTSDFFIGTGSSGVGSYISDKGFHRWLKEFIGWALPTVPNFNGSETILYLECIFPLFFIEQKRGWSEIQANTPNNWGIKNVKKAAIEFCLTIDAFEYEKKLNELKSKIDLASTEWNVLKSKVEGVADFNTVKVHNLTELKTLKSMPQINFSYLVNNTYQSLDTVKHSLEKNIEQLSTDLIEKTPQDEKLTAQLSIVNNLLNNLGEEQSEIEILLLSNFNLDSKLEVLNNDLLQYQQLKKLKSLGSIETEIDTTNCPICQSELHDTLGQHTHSMQPMSLLENINFLKNQIAFFATTKQKNLEQIETLRASIKVLRAAFVKENEKLSIIRESLEDINGEASEIIRHKLEAEQWLKDLKKLEDNQINLNAQAERIYSDWVKADRALATLKKETPEKNSEAIISRFESIMKTYLNTFNFNKSSLSEIVISRQTLKPEQNGYDIVSGTSASDFIRVIWSYTLALLKLAAIDETIKHGGFVVMDEPGQHDIGEESFKNLVIQGSNFCNDDAQIIIATSRNINQVSAACNNLNVNLINYNEKTYILRKDEVQVNEPLKELNE